MTEEGWTQVQEVAVPSWGAPSFHGGVGGGDTVLYMPLLEDLGTGKRQFPHRKGTQLLRENTDKNW